MKTRAFTLQTEIPCAKAQIFHTTTDLETYSIQTDPIHYSTANASLPVLPMKFLIVYTVFFLLRILLSRTVVSVTPIYSHVLNSRLFYHRRQYNIGDHIKFTIWFILIGIRTDGNQLACAG